MAMMDITPAPAFMEAVRQVLGIDDLVPGPDVVIPAIRSNFGSKIRARHEEIICSRAGKRANEAANKVKQEGGDQDAIAAAWKREFEEIQAAN